MNDKLNETFLDLISKADLITFFGIAKILSVPMVQDDEEKTPLDFADVLEGVMKKFSSANRKMRRDIIKVMKDANRTKNSNSQRK